MNSAPAFETPGGAFDQVVDVAIVAFIMYLAIIVAVIIAHSVAYLARPVTKAPGVWLPGLGQEAEERDRAGV